MDIINIEELFSQKQVTMVVSVPESVAKLFQEIYLNGYYYGLQGLSEEEALGALVVAGICVTVPKEKWKRTVPLYKDENELELTKYL